MTMIISIFQYVKNNLFQKTPLQSSFSGNFLALMGSGTQPERFTLRSALDYFLDFRFTTIRRRSAFKLDKVASRAHIVQGLLKALERVDEIIEVVRSAPDQVSAKNALMDDGENSLALSEKQADAVLKLQLGQLTRLNKDKLLGELNDLEKSITELETLMSDDSAVRSLMTTEFDEMNKKYGIPRRTTILADEGTLEDIDLVRNSRSVIVLTRSGYIKRMPLASFENQKRGTKGKKGTASSSGADGSEVAHCFTCNDHDTIIVTTFKGIAYGVRAYQIPTASRTARGVPIPQVLPVASDDVIASVLPVSEFTDDEYIVLATENGWIKRTPLVAFENMSSRGLIIASLEEGDYLKWCAKCTDDDDILVGSKHGMVARFNASQLRPTGRTSRGVISMKLREGDKLADMSILSSNDDSSKFVLAITSHGYGKLLRTDDFCSRARGGIGVIGIKFKGSHETDKAQCFRVVNEDDEVLLITEKGIIVRQNVGDISCQSRQATGVLVQKVDVENGDMISSISIVPKSQIDESDEE